MGKWLPGKPKRVFANGSPSLVEKTGGRAPRVLLGACFLVPQKQHTYVEFLFWTRDCAGPGRCNGLSGNEANVLLYQIEPPKLCSQWGPPASCTMQRLHNSHLSNLDSCFKSKVSQLHSWLPASCIALGSNCQGMEKKPGQLWESEKTIITSWELTIWIQGSWWNGERWGIQNSFTERFLSWALKDK